MAAVRRLTHVLAGGAVAAALLLAGCASTPQAPARKHAPTPAAPVSSGAASSPEPSAPALPPAGSGRGAYYQDDGPGAQPPSGLQDVPDAQVRKEPYSTHSNRPYVVFGKTYTPMLNDEPFSQRGMASWYGKKFHGHRTSSGEIYDMYKMTAAHPTLPIPSFARLTNISNGKQVVVRINDRGPFHPGRIIDVSFTAATKLGLLGAGSQEVELERLLPGEVGNTAAARPAPPVGGSRIKVARPSAPPSIAALMLGDAALPLAVDTGLSPASAANTDDRVALPKASAQLVATAAATVEPVAVASARVDTPAGADQPLAGAFYLQLGAYSAADKAEAARAQLAPFAKVLGMIEVVSSGALHRLFGGPFATRAQAALAAHDLPLTLNLKPLIVER